jgi:hypothetical protein
VTEGTGAGKNHSQIATLIGKRGRCGREIKLQDYKVIEKSFIHPGRIE